jgi:hypothetical protein
MSETRKRIAEIISDAKPALAALRFFTATTRGFRDREQSKLAAYLKEICELDSYTKEEVKEWLKTKAGYVDTQDYRRGDTSGYLKLLQNIPAHLLARTREYAMFIASGSGRRLLSDQMRERIASEFSENPIVVPPPQDDTPQLGVRITLNGIEPL